LVAILFPILIFSAARRVCPKKATDNTRLCSADAWPTAHELPAAHELSDVDELSARHELTAMHELTAVHELSRAHALPCFAYAHHAIFSTCNLTIFIF
jgi:hypothetical protein